MAPCASRAVGESFALPSSGGGAGPSALRSRSALRLRRAELNRTVGASQTDLALKSEEPEGEKGVRDPRADGDLSKFLQRITLTHYALCYQEKQAVWVGEVGIQGRSKIRVGNHDEELGPPRTPFPSQVPDFTGAPASWGI